MVYGNKDVGLLRKEREMETSKIYFQVMTHVRYVACCMLLELMSVNPSDANTKLNIFSVKKTNTVPLPSDENQE